ncbi:F-box domain-containing protein [Cedratvirus Zaza IHUMI]|uniref:F-box domain-containing protein n=1 Tax=Cedratvirus Zaza IHUMI TaxID=2126979 RepID=A0A2R8FE90_9VIRU|nr:F-box domain-containing protein [Cedratvirus Zaza IHUMI]
MQYLPGELQEEVLFSLEEPDDLFRVCSTSKESRQVCSNPSFWREKFRRENLPLVEEGNNFTEWLRIYQKSLKTAQETDNIINSGDRISISLVEVPEPSMLGPLVKVAAIEQLWKKAHESTNVTRLPGRVEIHRYFLKFHTKRNEKRYIWDLIDSVLVIPENPYEEPQSYNIDGGSTSTEDLWFIVYQLRYSGKNFY